MVQPAEPPELANRSYLPRITIPQSWSAVRRLIIVAARWLVVEVSPPRPRKPKPQPEPIYVLDRVNDSIVSVPLVLPQPLRPPAPHCETDRAEAQKHHRPSCGLRHRTNGQVIDARAVRVG